MIYVKDNKDNSIEGKSAFTKEFLMLNLYTYRYDFDNFEYPYRFKIKFKNGSKFKFLNNYYKYCFNHKEGDQTLYCYCCLEMKDKKEAERRIRFSNNVLQYICITPLDDKSTYVYESDESDDTYLDNFNTETKNIAKLSDISEKIFKFKVDRGLFEEVMGLNGIALLGLVNDNMEDSVLYYFKIIEKLSKRNYVKYHEKNYTKKVKQINKNILRNFIEKYFNENLKVKMSENMLNTSTDEIYKKMRSEAYSAIFLKISFFCNFKKISVDLNKLNELVKTRNKLAHGDLVDIDALNSSLVTASSLSNEFIASYFFQKKYKEVNLNTDIYEKL